MTTKTKKVTRKPRTIQVVEDAPVAPKRGRKKAEATLTVGADATPAAIAEPVATDAKPAGKKRKPPVQAKKLSAVDAATQISSELQRANRRDGSKETMDKPRWQDSACVALQCHPMQDHDGG